MGKKKSERFGNYEDYQKSASETAKKVAYNRKHNAVLNYQFGKPFEGLKSLYDFPFPEDKEDYFLNYCDCAINLINEFFHETLDFERSGQINDIIFWNIVPTTQQSFERWGDKNNLSKNLKKNYISEQGTPIDSQAEELSLRFGITIIEDDLVDFITTYSEGKKAYPRWFYISKIKEILKGMVDFTIDIDFAREFIKSYQKAIPTTKKETVLQVETQNGNFLDEECPF